MNNQSIHKPNFFIVGAPKCGTTSLWEWLRTHPDIFFPLPKEPHFFSFDYHEGDARNLEEYEDLFANASSYHRIVGEASTGYLRSEVALSAILAYADCPKILIAIRNPVDMAISFHNFQYLHEYEDVRDFWTAWHLQDKRRYGAHMPSNCRDPRDVWYGDICSLGSQLKALYDQVPEERIHIIQLEHMKKNPQAEYRRLLRFLGVGDDGRREFPVANSASERRFKSAWSGFKRLDKAICATGIKMPRIGLMSKVSQFTQKPVDKQPALYSSQRDELVDYFRDEIRLAEQVTGLNLEHWRQ